MAVYSVGDGPLVRDAVWVNGADDGEEALEGKGARDVEFHVES